MQPRTRVLVFVFLAAVAAAGATVGLTALTSDPKPGGRRSAPTGRRCSSTSGSAPTPRPSRSVARSGSSPTGKRDAAAATFARFRSVDAQVGRRRGRMAGEHGHGPAGARRRARRRTRPSGCISARPSTATARRAEAEAEWRAAKLAEPDSLLAVRASDYLNPQYPVPGIPVFVPGFAYPSGLSGLTPRRQLEVLQRRARAGNSRAKILYGVALQRLGRQLSAERQYAAAARLAPDDPEAQAAAAVGRFDKDRPAAAFSRLGPLSRRFPQAATVRFHLGLLLLWLGQVDEGRRQLVRARRLAPGSPIGREAARYLARLADSTP